MRDEEGVLQTANSHQASIKHHGVAGYAGRSAFLFFVRS